MATIARPGYGDHADEPARVTERRPNIASANVQLPAVADYEQVDREILGTLKPTFAWLAALGVAVLGLAVGAAGGCSLSVKSSPRITRSRERSSSVTMA